MSATIDPSSYFGTLPRESSSRPMTTLISFDFIPGVDCLNNDNAEGRAWGSIMSRISCEHMWEYTMLTEPLPVSNQRIAFIGQHSYTIPHVISSDISDADCMSYA